MTPAQQKLNADNLYYAKEYLDAVLSICDEDFVPELAGMAERVGVILSAVKAGYYTTNPPAPIETQGKTTKGIRLTRETKSDMEFGYSHPIIASGWECTRCNEYLKEGDYVDNLTSQLKHISCERPQG